MDRILFVIIMHKPETNISRALKFHGSNRTRNLLRRTPTTPQRSSINILILELPTLKHIPSNNVKATFYSTFGERHALVFM